MTAIALTPWLDHLSEHLPVARAGRDPEGVHQLRVAVRRLRVWLELAGMRTLEDDLAWLVRTAGGVRDLEVLLELPDLPAGFRKWAGGKLAQAREGLIPALDGPRLAGLLRALAVLPPLEPGRAEARLGRMVRRVGRRAEEWRAHDSVESLHALRRALRRLRYAREWLGLDAAAVKALQEIFGRVGDLSFVLGYLAAYEAEGGRALRYRAKLEALQAAAVLAAKQAWQEHRHDLEA